MIHKIIPKGLEGEEREKGRTFTKGFPFSHSDFCLAHLYAKKIPHYVGFLEKTFFFTVFLNKKVAKWVEKVYYRVK